MELNDFLKKLNNSIEYAKLSASRKSALKSRILYLVKLKERPRTRSISSFLFPILRPVPILAGVMILLITGGSVSFAAENSLPGDVLYPVKVNLNENIISALNFTPEAKAAWELAKTSRRLTEAGQLAAQGKEDSAAQAELASNFEDNSTAVQESIRSLKEQGNVKMAAKLASKFEATLKAHQEILDAVTSAQNTTGTLELQNNLNDKLAETEAVRAVLEAEIVTSVDGNTGAAVSDAKSRIKKAQSKLDSIKRFIGDNSDKLSIGAVRDVNQKLSVASGEIENAQNKLVDGLAGDAFNSADNAAAEAEKIQLLLQAQLNLGIYQDDPSLIPPETSTSSNPVSIPDDSQD